MHNIFVESARKIDQMHTQQSCMLAMDLLKKYGRLKVIKSDQAIFHT